MSVTAAPARTLERYRLMRLIREFETEAEKILPLPDDTHVLPGHGATTTVGWERKTNPFLLELQQ